MANLLTAADILLRVGVDATGVSSELASKLTASERVAVASGNRISASVAANSEKVQVATLRVAAAQERYALTLQREGATQGQVAASQASLISARRTLAVETNKAAAATTNLDRRTSGLRGTVAGFVGATAGFAAFSFLRRGIDENKEFQETLAQSEAGIKSTGGAANVTADDVQNLASKVQRYSGEQDELVAGAENLLLTFTNVRNEVGKGNDIFNRATVAAADLKARGFSDLEGSAKQLGKALQDPIKGTGALSRAGVQFTAEQKATIASLVETGDLLSAQKIILREVETQVGGSARAFGETLPGQMARSSRAIDDFSQGTVAALAPALEALAGTATFFAEHKTARDAALFAGGTVAALLVLNKGIKLYREVSLNVLRRAPSQVAANAAVAQSYNGIAVAADRAAAAEGRAATAGVAGGRLGALGGVARAAGPAGLVVGTLLAGSALLNKTADDGLSDFERLARTDPKAAQAQLKGLQAEIARVSSLAQGTGARTDPAAGLRQQAGLLSKAIREAAPGVKAAAKAAGAAAGGAYGSAFKASAEAETFAAHALFSGGARAANVKTAREALAEAIDARNQASSALSDARTGGGSGTAATATDIRVAELRLQSARQNAAKDGSTASEKASVLSAQQRLNDLRTKGKATAEETATAEGKVAAAIDSQRDAQKRVNEARKALDEARGITAQEALKRIQGDAKAQGQLKGDLEKLLGKGATRGELSALKELEDQSPGTIHRIAQTSGKKFHDDFAEALGRINRRTSAIEKLFDGAETIGEHRGRRLAEATARGFAKRLKDYDFGEFFGNLGPPTPPTTTATGGRVSNKVRHAGFPGA